MENSTLLTFTVLMLFLAFILLPMVPMLKSIYKKEDTTPLYLDLDYIHNPKFKVENFVNALNSNNGQYTKISIEKELSNTLIPTNVSQQLLFMSHEKVTVKERIEKEGILYSTEDIVLHKGSNIFALKSDGNILVEKESSVDSWIDAAGEVTVEEGATINLVTAKSVKLSSGAKFKRVFADTIGIYPLNKGDENKLGIDVVHDKVSQYIEEQVLYFDKNHKIEKGSNINNDIVCRGNLIIEEGCKILGSIKTNGTLVIENDTYVYGNIFSDKTITINDNCFIFGNIFSHAYVEIGENGQIGKYSLPKSIIGIKGIQIAGGTFIHNYVLTYGIGRII